MQSPMWTPGLNASHPLANGLAAYWPMWEGDGDKALDLAGGNTGTLTGGPTWVATEEGGALAFDGSNQYIANTALADVSGQTWAFFARYRLDSYDTNGNIIFSSDNAAGGNIWIQLGDPIKRLAYNGGEFVCSGLESDWVDGLWHTLAVVFDSAPSIRAYVDGQLVGEDTDNHVAWTAGAKNNQIGHYVGGDFWNWEGQIGPVALYNRALTHGEVAQLYATPDILTRYRRLV